MLKKIALGFVALFAVVYLIGFTLPATFHVEVEENVIAAPKMVFAYVGDLKRWRDWQTWYEMDPEMQAQVSEPSYGVNATSQWESKKMGKGEIRLTEWKADEALAYTMNIEGWNPSTGRLEMRGAAQGATVRWSMDGSTGKNPLARYMGLVMKYFVTRDFRQGLAKLKKVAESHAASDIQAPWDAKK
jgi:hypothetical protein